MTSPTISEDQLKMKHPDKIDMDMSPERDDRITETRIAIMRMLNGMPYSDARWVISHVQNLLDRHCVCHVKLPEGF